jgi:hypothetical protein
VPFRTRRFRGAPVTTTSVPLQYLARAVACGDFASPRAYAHSTALALRCSLRSVRADSLARHLPATSLRRALTLTPLRSLFAARSAPFAATRMRGPAGDFASLRADAYSTTLAPRCSFRSVRGDSHARHLPATSLRCALTLTPLRSLFAARSGPFTPTARAAPARDFASPRAYSLRSCDLHSDSRRPLKNS